MPSPWTGPSLRRTLLKSLRVRMRSRLMLLLGLFLVASLVLPITAVSQDQEEESDDPAQLPEIAPREIEIRGQLQIAFPSLQRQPLDGFSSDPPLPSVPDTHRPYVESYKQELEDLPESLPELETTTQSLEAAQAPPARGFFETGTGRYFTRFAEGRLSVPLTQSETFTVHGDYSGTEGFTAFETPSVQTPSDDAEASLSFESRRDPVVFDARLHGAAHQYTLYGATPALGSTVLRAPERDAYSLGSMLRLRTRGTVESTLQASYDYTQYSTQFMSADQGAADVFSESRFKAQGDVRIPIGPLPPRLDAEGTHSRFGGDVPAETAFDLDLGASVPLLSTEPLSVNAGARLLTFEAPADPTQQNTPSAEATFIVPSADVQWNLTRASSLYFRNSPRLREGSLSQLYSDNPYAEHAPSLRPTLETTNAEAGLRFSAGPIRVSTVAGYRYAPSYQYFEPGGDARYTQGIFDVTYESARIIHGGGQLALEGTDNLQMSVRVSLRDGELTEMGTIIPNFAPLTADAMFSYSFADNQGRLQLNGHFRSARYPTTARQETLDPYFSADLEGSYAVTSSFDIVAQAKNLSVESPTLWARYPRPPAMLTAGVRIHW